MTFSRTVCAFVLATLLPAFLRAEKTNEISALKSEPSVGTSGAEEEASHASAEKPTDSNFERYRTILDRMPFGPEPANFNPDAPGGRGGTVGGEGAPDAAAQEAMKSQEEQQILASVRISALNVTPSGKIAVGFTDSSKQPAGTYYLKVGETRDGWTVKAADAREMKVTLEREGVEATLGLGEGSGDHGKDGKKGGKALGGAGAARHQVGRLAQNGLLHPAQARTPESTLSAGGSAIANLRARRAQKEAERQEEAARQAAAAEQARADREKAAAERERAAAEREQQRETLLQIQEELRRQREAKEQQQGEMQQSADQNEE